MKKYTHLPFEIYGRYEKEDMTSVYIATGLLAIVLILLGVIIVTSIEYYPLIESIK